MFIWMEHCECRISSYCSDLLSILVRLLYDIWTEPPGLGYNPSERSELITAQDDLVELSVKCIALLQSLVPKQTNKHLYAVQQADKFTTIPWYKLIPASS